MNREIEALQKIIDRSLRLVFFGGAGVSTASGIPDFRSADGLYTKEYGGLSPEEILSNIYYLVHMKEFYDFYRKYMVYPEAQPNAAHRKLYELEKADKLRGIVTQNIDGLHRMAVNRRVYEIHGSVHENYCLECDTSYSLETIMKSTGIPRCEKCGGIIKPYVVLYGEAPDRYTMIGARREISNADTLIVAGTSLSVEPAASFLDDFHGRSLVVINREPTPADERADLIIRDDVAAVMAQIKV
ncbi:MAG: NAD-dependent protein deacylase [Solobacterium sp.]|nr:NAD-dependent protein deacylase [Solobacterium sp.]